MQTYDCISVADDKRKSGETNDCGVVAMAIAADVSYDFARGILHSNGRLPKKGTPEHTTINGLYDLGWHLEDVTGYRGKSIQTVRKAFPEGVYLINTKGHIFCLRDGIIEDFSRFRSFRVRQVRQVVRWYCEECNGFRRVNAYDCPPAELVSLPDELAEGCREAIRYRFASRFITNRKLCYDCAKRLHAYTRY